MEQSLQGSIPLRHLLNEEICVDGLTEVKEVNDWDLNFTNFFSLYFFTKFFSHSNSNEKSNKYKSSLLS